MSIVHPLKRCSKCGTEYPATTEYFHRAKDAKDGLDPRCKKCKRGLAREHYVKNRENLIEYSRNYRHANSGRLQDYHRKYYQANRTRLAEERRTDQFRAHRRAYLQEYYSRNPERRIKYNRRYYENHKKQAVESVRRWRRNNPEKERARLQRYNHAHPHAKRVRDLRRRARKVDAPGIHTPDDIRAQIKAQTNGRGELICWWCDEPIRGKYHVDHRIPLDKGGSNDAGNICIAHPECNLSKYDKMPWEFNGRLL